MSIVSLISFSAMVGAVGGDVGIGYGYQRFMPEVMVVVIVVLILLVQSAGDRLARRINKRKLRH